jgi:3-hydroxymyristoyl/3-hydroxydecanoyl-(acyl carrier protein) dehydratase
VTAQAHARLFHRFPFVLFDHAGEAGDGASTARRVLSIDDALLEGGSCPTLTQSLLVEAMAQTAAIFAEPGGARRSGMLVGLKRIRFGAVPAPGDQLVVSARLTQRFGDLLRIEGRVTRGEETVSEGEILISLGAAMEVDP